MTAMDIFYIAIGEREQAAGLSEQDAAVWAELWNAHPLGHAPFYPACLHGARAKVLDEVYGLPRTTTFMSLLAPHPAAGEWDASAARHNARELLRVLAPHAERVRLFLLGRRVARAFGCGALSFGLTGWPGGLCVLLLPAPSLSNKNNQHYIRDWVRDFLLEQYGELL